MAERKKFTYEIATNQSRGLGCVAGLETVDRQLTIAEQQEFFRRFKAKEFDGDADVGAHLLGLVIVDKTKAPTAKWLAETLMPAELTEFILRVVPELRPQEPE